MPMVVAVGRAVGGGEIDVRGGGGYAEGDVHHIGAGSDMGIKLTLSFVLHTQFGEEIP